MPNPGPSVTSTTNTVTPYGNFSSIESINVNLGTIAGILTITTTEITFSGLGSGIRAGDVIIGVSKPTAQAGLGIAGWRNDPSVDDKFYITYVNPTAGTVTPTAGQTYTLIVGHVSTTLGAVV